MIKRTVLISIVNDVKEFVEQANKVPFAVEINAGRFVVDAKSIMGVFSLNLSEPVEIVINADEETAKPFLEGIKQFIV